MKNDRAETKEHEILSGWKEIANYMGKGVRTVQRYERLLGLPVRRPAGKPWGSVVATKAEIDAWVGASPIREGLQLLRPATGSSLTTWADVQGGAAEMKKLAKQMLDLRRELRDSVRLLRESVRDVRAELNGTRRIGRGTASTSSVFNLLNMETGGRKVS